MKIIVEKDKKKNIGYQVSVIDGPLMKVYRGTPEFMSLADSCRIARQLLEEHNQRFGTHYQPEDCIGIDEEAFEANAGRDVDAARAWKEIKTGHFNDLTPSPIDADDIFKSQVSVKRGQAKEGKEKISINITQEGLFLVLVKAVLFGAGDDKLDDPQSSAIIDAFCRHLASHGYGKGATEIRSKMENMGEKRCTVWVYNMLQRYHITDDDFNRFAYEAGFR